jgi:hypothetical protein
LTEAIRKAYELVRTTAITTVATTFKITTPIEMPRRAITAVMATVTLTVIVSVRVTNAAMTRVTTIGTRDEAEVAVATS